MGAFHAIHQAVEIIDDDDDDDDLSEEFEEYVAEALRQIGPAVEGIARARGADRIAGLLAGVTQSCLEELFAGNGQGASRFLDRIMQLDTGPRSLSWLYEPLSSVVDEVTSGLDDEETISADAVCAMLVRYEDGYVEVPPREDLLDDHAASFVLARLVVAGFATPTDQGLDLLEDAWNALMEASQ